VELKILNRLKVNSFTISIKKIYFCHLVTPNSSRIPVPVENLYVEHHQKSRLGYGETFDIVSAPKPGSLAPLKNIPRFLLLINKPQLLIVI